MMNEYRKSLKYGWDFGWLCGNSKEMANTQAERRRKEMERGGSVVKD